MPKRIRSERHQTPRSRAAPEPGGSGVSLLTDRIFDEVKQRILQFRIRPGERLLEDDLAREWQASRTPVREACKRLVQAGLLRGVPRRGYYVRDINLPEIEELYEVRVALETFAVVRVVEQGRGGHLAGQRQVWARIPDPLPLPDVMLQRDEAFHNAIAEAGGNVMLAAHLRTINERIRAIRAKDFEDPHRIRTTYTQHRDILDLIAGEHGSAAADAMRSHIVESRTHAVQAVKELLAAAYLR